MICHSRSVHTSGIRCSKRSALLQCKTLRLRLGHQMIGYTMRWTLCCSWCSSMVLVYTGCPQHARGEPFIPVLKRRGFLALFCKKLLKVCIVGQQCRMC